ncbi:Eco57I restriction-modification methylase domain-containing protein [Nodosilinea sp. E11]|uniref:Eco57I restriction-modification methylase domain-containing protein n=1 Tax=Nodosilinea sp. E11 TaxID=3037479 RepID=UPI003977BDE9
MASLFTPGSTDCCRLLDAGAGVGSLSSAFLDRWVSGDLTFNRVELDAFEIDQTLHSALAQTLTNYQQHPNFCPTIHPNDFIHAAADWLSGNLFATALPQYTHAILNPPYKKIRSDSPHRLALRRAGVETVNLYSAFVALALALLGDGGQLVAIIPRSFCNGPYYRPFRQLVLGQAAIHHIHLFESRTQAFKDDAVLQENIIIRLERGGSQGPVSVSTSTDDTFADLVTHQYPFGQIVLPGDLEQFIHVPTSPDNDVLTTAMAVQHSLAQLGLKVSTGPVVDFRVKPYLRAMPETNTVPLIYPMHCVDGGVVWPIPNAKKPNAIQRHVDTDKWLYASGFYCVVRRFSAKEERRRVMACVIDPATFGNAAMLGFENHLNVFHVNRAGLPRPLAYGLALFLNTTAIDDHFRRFNGHTQVNATDLRLIKYPSLAMLTRLGEWAIAQPKLTQTTIDRQFEAEMA